MSIRKSIQRRPTDSVYFSRAVLFIIGFFSNWLCLPLALYEYGDQLHSAYSKEYLDKRGKQQDWNDSQSSSPQISTTNCSRVVHRRRAWFYFWIAPCPSEMQSANCRPNFQTFVNTEFQVSATNSSGPTEKKHGSTFGMRNALLNCKTINEILFSIWLQWF